MWTKKDCRGEFGTFTGLKKVLLCCPGQVDVPSGQVAFHSHLLNGKGIRKLFVNYNCGFESYLYQGKAGIQVFSSPDLCHCH